jgi:hypothetical protein
MVIWTACMLREDLVDGDVWTYYILREVYP